MLLCSDGLTEMVQDGEIERVLQSTLPDITEAARRLVVMANEAGGRDNISVVLVRVHPQGAADEQ
jgi:protein phosphatase